MESEFEVAVKHKTTLGAIRNVCKCKIRFRDAYNDFIGDTINIVNSELNRIKLKEEALEVYTAMLDEDIMAELEWLVKLYTVMSILV